MLSSFGIRTGCVLGYEEGVAVVTAKHNGVGYSLLRGEAYGGNVRESKLGGEKDGAMFSVISLSMLVSMMKVGKVSVKIGPSANCEQPA